MAPRQHLRIALTLVTGLFALTGIARAADTGSAPPALATLDWNTYASMPVAATGADAERVRRGKYIVTTSGCHDCHTPFKMGATGPELDLSRMLSGHPEQVAIAAPANLQDGPWVFAGSHTNTAWSGPWGVSFTANLTPDPETGLGKWTVRNFKDTIRSGRHLGRGRALLPPMPIPMYRHLTDEDLEAVFAYLQSIPPVRNRVPEPLPPAGADAVAATHD